MIDTTRAPGSAAPLDRGGLFAVALGVLVLQALVLPRYGWFRDELYYLSCAKRLAWGYVDHPPLSIAVLAAVRAVVGDSLVAIRAIAAGSIAALAVLTGLLARDLGGGGWAQRSAALMVSLAPLMLGTGHVFSMNALELPLWVAGAILARRAFAGPRMRDWAALGACLGLGLLVKWSVGWLAASLALALVLSPRRRVLGTAGPWLAALVLAAIVAPHVAWEARFGWPTLEFMRHASGDKMKHVGALELLASQLPALGIGGALFGLAGLVWSLGRDDRRPLAIAWCFTFALLVANGSARAGYLALAAPALVAAGAVWWEARPALARGAALTVGVLLALPLVPFALPVLPVERFVAWQVALGRTPSSDERKEMGVLPQHFADMHGWPEFADSLARVAATLTPEERARAVVVVRNYGEAGALERFGRGRVPPVACSHNQWWYWRPEWDGRLAIVVGSDSAKLAPLFGSVTRAGSAGHELAMPYERGLPLFVARGLRANLDTLWAASRHFD